MLLFSAFTSLDATLIFYVPSCVYQFKKTLKSYPLLTSYNLKRNSEQNLQYSNITAVLGHLLQLLIFPLMMYCTVPGEESTDFSDVSNLLKLPAASDNYQKSSVSVHPSMLGRVSTYTVNKVYQSFFSYVFLTSTSHIDVSGPRQLVS